MKLNTIILALAILATSCGLRSASEPSCEDGLDSLLQAKVAMVVKETMSENQEIPGIMVTIGESDCGKIRAHVSAIRHWRSSEIIDTLDLADSFVIMPGAIMQTATLAHLMEHHSLTLMHEIPTNHGEIKGELLPRSNTILDYELESGRDSISVRKAYLNSFSYLPYYLASEHLETRDGQAAYARDLNSYFGLRQNNKDWIYDYLPYNASNSTICTVASGHSIQLTQQQIVRFYALVAKGGMREGKSILKKETADSLSMLLRKNVINGTGILLSKNGVAISGKPGYGEAWQAPIAGLGTVNDEHRLKVNSFAGFYPSDDPKYVIVATILSRNNFGSGVMEIVKRIVND